MPVIDLAEAASRGDLIVDEFDALNAVNVGKLSEYKSARISPIIATHTMNLRNAHINGNASSSSDSTWDRILVDEVELARAAAAEQANANTNSTATNSSNNIHFNNNNGHHGHMLRPQSQQSRAAEMLNEAGGMDRDTDVWSSLLVDEVDFKHAIQHGDLSPHNNHISALHYVSENAISTDGEGVEMNTDEEETDDDDNNHYG